jgi:hypothetical protein
MVQRASDGGPGIICMRERERLATDLRFVMRHHAWSPTPEVVDALVDWQIEAVASARRDSWIPGMAGSRDPVVQDVLSRYYAQRLGMAVARLIEESFVLKQQLLEAVECIRFYALGASDQGMRANTALGPLLAPEQDGAVIPNFLVAWSRQASRLPD